MEKGKDAKSNFGKKGWLVIVYSGINWYIMGMLSVSLLNTLVPNYAVKLSLPEGALYGAAAIVGWIALALSTLLGRFVVRFGVRKVNGVALLATALSTVFLGSSNTFIAFCIAFVCLRTSVFVVQQAGGDVSISNWFPKKKGLAIGWATIGVQLNFTSVAFITAVTLRTGDMKFALYIIAGFVMVFCILNFLFFKDYPEDCGAYPDNDPTEVREDISKLKTGWTISKAVRMKEFWLGAFAVGFMVIITQGFMSSLIPNLMMKGFTQENAVVWMTITCAVGAFGSYFLGWLDQKLGIKISMITFSILAIIGIVCYFLPGNFIYGFLFIISFILGASSNYTISIAAQLFGRIGSAKILPVLFIIVEAIGMLSSMLMSLSLNMSGNYNLAWIIIGILSALGIVLVGLCNFSPRKDPMDE